MYILGVGCQLWLIAEQFRLAHATYGWNARVASSAVCIGRLCVVVVVHVAVVIATHDVTGYITGTKLYGCCHLWLHRFQPIRVLRSWADSVPRDRWLLMKMGSQVHSKTGSYSSDDGLRGWQLYIGPGLWPFSTTRLNSMSSDLSCPMSDGPEVVLVS